MSECAVFLVKNKALWTNVKDRLREGLNECKKREGPHTWHDFDNVDEC